MLPIGSRPPRGSGVVAVVLAVALVTGLLYPLKEIAPAVSLGVVYLVAVLFVASLWGLWPGVLTAVASALAFNFFHIPPTGALDIANGENWVALAVFLVAAIVVGTLAEQARTRALEAEERRREADLAAELARLLLGAEDAGAARGAAARRIAQAFGLDAVALVDGTAQPGERRTAIPVGEGRATLLVPTTASAAVQRRLAGPVADTLAALLEAATARDRLLDEAVESQALRRSEDIKTTLLRAVSHDLRSPLTGIVASAEALHAAALEPAERDELATGIADEGRRLSAIVDNLLDLSRLEAGRAVPRRSSLALDEVLDVAAEGLDRDRIQLRLDPGLPPLSADASQLERVFHNLLENGLEHWGDAPVQVRARVIGDRLVVRVVDQGPGIPAAEHERIFEPFYRAGDARRSAGSGLGLAIVKGFVEAHGGDVGVDSLPGQGASIVVRLPLA